MSAKYKAYPDYQESGEEWLGSVPSHWDVFQIKHLSSVKRGASPRPIDDPKYFDEDGEYVWTRIADVTASDVYLTKAPQKLSDLGSSLSVKLEPESLFLSIAGTVGKPCITGMKACIHDGFVYFPELKIPSKFLFYVFAGEQAYKGLGKFGTQLNLNTDTVGGIKVGCTTNEELEEIVRFLDHETAKIDTLIEKQQQLIKLLKEKRQAVISHAVTKGLNPNAPMRDSGVEWLGEVPEHWTIKRLKHISPKVGVGLVINPSTYTKDEGVYFIFGGDVKEYHFDLSKTRRILPEDSDNLLPSRLKHRDLVSIRVGYPGITAVVTEDLEGSNCASVIVIRRGSYNSDWLCAGMNVWVGRQQVDLVSYGAAQKQFNVSDAIEFIFPVPPESEQDEIAIFVQDSLYRFNTLSEKAEKQIELLQERRTALISAAVTGKIDVRNWQAPKPSCTNNKEDAA
jgi:type I restriction enzyme S subunit